ncbi:translation initiation factor IF-2 [Candidatus Micrarchaeota archaeon RBG_16_49_10]|nr:MAG: translation initiation factor IF-2 [Candidatus Micrarchaeota archaeon RBG_16_49_10]
MIRQPIVAILGHVDHGKTTLLDSIRGTTVQIGEPGGITQHIGASFIPIDVVKDFCGGLLQKLNISMEIPGLLFIDTPGHESFTTLRKRGGSIADLAILLIDITKGFQPQTEESLQYLKQFKTPFIVAATKVDLLPGWYPKKNACFIDSFAVQNDRIKGELEDKLYTLVAQLSERGFNAERFDRITDFTKEIAIVPCSGKTGEGVPELLMMLAGLSQQFLKDKLTLSDKARGSVLEVKDVKGFGTTVDVILYDGSAKVGDFLIIGGREPLRTKVKALLRPPALRELRVEKKFDSVDEVHAAAGIKIAAPNLEGVIAGSPVICVSDERDVEACMRDVQKDLEEVQFKREIEGVIIKADTLGSLEAMIKIFTDKGIPIKKAGIGVIVKQDVIDGDTGKEDLRRVVLGFNVSVLSESEELARDLKVKIFLNNIIYRLLEEYSDWHDEAFERRKQEKLGALVRPCKIRIIPGFVFRNAKPAVFGVDVLEGLLKQGAPMMLEGGKDVGKVDQIQKDGKNIDSAKRGDKVAVSMGEPTVGRQVSEGNVLVSVITKYTLKGLKDVYEKLSESEKQLLRDWGLV